MVFSRVAILHRFYCIVNDHLMVIKNIGIFSYNCFGKKKKIGATTRLIYPNSCYNEACYKGTAVYINIYIYIGSYTSAVLLNLLNKLGKRDKMQDFPSILSLSRNKFNKFNNTGA